MTGSAIDPVLYTQLHMTAMNDPKQDITDTFLATIGQMEKYLQQSGTIVLVRDRNHDIVYANPEFAKRLDTDTTTPTEKWDNASLPEAVHSLFSAKEDEVFANGKPLVHDEKIPFPNSPEPFSTVYFPVKNEMEETIGVGIFGIPSSNGIPESGNRENRPSAINADIDLLTGIPNRESMETLFANEVAQSGKNGKHLSVVLINIDNFTRINDEWGRGAGDIVLVEFCELIRNHLRSSDLFGRWEDRQFLLILPDTNVVIASQVAERIRLAIEQRQFHKTGKLTASFGVALHDRGEMIEDCLGRADAAVFVAKMNGKNRVEVDRAGMVELPLPNLKASNFLKLVWKREYECGNTIIDYQHRMMVIDANHLLAAILDNTPKKQITPLINKLLAHIQQHFDEEEGILAKIGYRETEEHALIHRQLIQKAVRLSVRFEENKLDFGEIFNFLANDVVIEHMIKTDKKYFAYLPEARN